MLSAHCVLRGLALQLAYSRVGLHTASSRLHVQLYVWSCSSDAAIRWVLQRTLCGLQAGVLQAVQQTVDAQKTAHSTRCVSAHVGVGKQGALVTVQAGVHDDVQPGFGLAQCLQALRAPHLLHP